MLPKLMAHKEQTEVLVVGAGPVGMFTALLLARNGVRTRIIDQASQTAGHSYACALHPRTLQLLNEAGVASTAFRASKRIEGVGFYQGASRRAAVQLSRLPAPFPFVLALPQSGLEDLLQSELRRAGVEIAWNHRLQALENRDGGATASIERLAATGHGYSVPEFELTVKDSVQVEARFVVGADGQNSTVRQRLEIPFAPAGAPQYFVVYEGEGIEDCGKEVKVVLDDGTDSAMWPLSDTRVRWSFQLAAAKTLEDFPAKERQRMVVVEQSGEEDSLHQLRELLRERAPWFRSPIKEVVWGTDVQFEPRLARQFGKGSCWLAGDAAHQTGPLGMQSMNIGFREAAALADSIKHILRDGAPMDLERRYGQERWREWKCQLGLGDGPLATGAAGDWVRQRALRILSSLPASGEEINELLGSLGILFK
jgi:2-polyprenyl-6-methoxyphenol hydroxylase-like FAD-dependent oxidoreductase